MRVVMLCELDGDGDGGGGDGGDGNSGGGGGGRGCGGGGGDGLVPIRPQVILCNRITPKPSEYTMLIGSDESDA